MKKVNLSYTEMQSSIGQKFIPLQYFTYYHLFLIKQMSSSN